MVIKTARSSSITKSHFSPSAGHPQKHWEQFTSLSPSPFSPLFRSRSAVSRLRATAPSGEPLGKSSCSPVTVPSCHPSSVPLINAVGGLSARALAQLNWLSSHHWPHKEPSIVQFSCSWLKRQLSHNGGDFLIMLKMLYLPEKYG